MPGARKAQRIHGISTTIFAQMSAIAARTGAVNLGQGFPDTEGPGAVVEAAVAALRGGRNQYPPGHGTPELVAAVCAHQRRHYGLEVGPDQVVATTGATEAIAAALLGLTDPGDEVVVLEPYYDSYVAMIQMAGCTRRPVTLRAPDFRIHSADLRAAITERTRLILLNSPHNPTGRVLDRAELEMVAAAAIEHDLVVVTDEVYEHLTFDDHVHIPLATLPGMAARTLSISSAGKTFSFTGWKIGWASGPADLVAAVEGAKNWLSYASGAPLQPAVATALNEHDDFHRALRQDLQDRRDLLCEGLRDLDLDVFVPEGTYFVTTDVRRLGYRDGRELCDRLPGLAGVVAIPEQVFYDDQEAGGHLVRWAFCKDADVIVEGLRRLHAVDLHAR